MRNSAAFTTGRNLRPPSHRLNSRFGRIVYAVIPTGMVLVSCLAAILPLGRLAKFDQVLRIGPGVGVAFEPARCPGQVDQQAAQDVTCVAACRALAVG